MATIPRWRLQMKVSQPSLSSAASIPKHTESQLVSRRHPQPRCRLAAASMSSGLSPCHHGGTTRTSDVDAATSSPSMCRRTLYGLVVGSVSPIANTSKANREVTNFADFSGDYNPLHTDEEFAKPTQFGGRIFHGPASSPSPPAWSRGSAHQGGHGDRLPGMTWNLKAAVKTGNTIHVQQTVAAGEAAAKSRQEIFTDARVLGSGFPPFVESAPGHPPSACDRARRRSVVSCQAACRSSASR